MWILFLLNFIDDMLENSHIFLGVGVFYYKKFKNIGLKINNIKHIMSII